MSLRKGHNSFASIPRSLMRDLNAGREHPLTLSEWLAVDPAKLLEAVLPGLGLGGASAHACREVLVREARQLSRQRGARRSKKMGEAFHRALAGLDRKEAVFGKMAGHPSPVVRAWAAYSLLADPDLTLARRIKEARRFAADRDQMVRECAWDSFRPWMARELPKGLKALQPWARSRDANVRRCAVEATRPRGVWTEHITALKEDPEAGRPILEPVRSDTSRYVRVAVGNWINDASKSRPDWARRLCRRWLRESPTPETEWIVRHGLRTLRKAGRDR